MNSIPEIVLTNDIFNLPKNTLQELCTDLDIDDSGLKGELTTKIVAFLETNKVSKKDVFQKFNKRILAGKTSITWYSFDKMDTATFVDTLEESYNENPFENLTIPADLTTDPVLIGAARGDTDSEYYLRVMYKNGVRQEFNYHGEMTVTPKHAVSTVYVHLDQGLLEIRGDSRKANDIAEMLAEKLKQKINLDLVGHPFGQAIGTIADSLGGELIDATTTPGAVLEEFTEDQAVAVANVLVAIDDYFSANDTAALEEKLLAANAAFQGEGISTKFSALILSGMEKIGLAGSREIRGLPLYDYLSPNLDHHSGFVRFTHTENGVEKEYTARVGMKQKSIFFTTPATEDVIQFVRDNVINKK
jgi:hypothetical protein